MSDVLTRYRELDYPQPATYLSWDLFGAGLDNLGRDRKPVELPLRNPETDEILLRVDAIGLCFSDAKLIKAGSEHPRIRGRDLSSNPTVPGHEASLTVVKVGADWKGKFSPGQRYIIQADIFINGEQKAFGYVQRGALAQYTYAGPWILDGDDGCYLLPVQPSSGYAEAALVEPWACVENAYQIAARTQPKPNGRLLLVFTETLQADLQDLYASDKPPAAAAVLGDFNVDLSPVLGPMGHVKRTPPTPEHLSALAQETTGDDGFDDIILVGKASSALVRACDAALGKDGILAFVGPEAINTSEIDIGRIHYHFTRHVGTHSLRVRDAYLSNTREDLKAGGLTWMIGAAGPMGQMHMQRALELDSPPARIFATDISQERLDFMLNRLQPLAEKNNVEIVCCNTNDVGNIDSAINAFTGGNGFDDVYVHAPVAALVSHAANFLAEGAVLNIFAGVQPGTMASLSPDIFQKRHARVIGSSGSSMRAFTEVLEKMESSRLATRMSLAALGSIEAAWDGLKGVQENRYPGKTVIYPHLTPLPLQSPDALNTSCPAAAALLEHGNIWTTAAENSLLEAQLRL